MDVESFHCIGADCPDNCCSGWRVSVDHSTFDKYRSCADPRFAARFHTLVTINAEPTEGDFATIVSTDSTCPFLAEKLCSIQRDLGEDYLSRTCAAYPRVANVVNGVVERSLDLSCPEAARLVLSDDATPIRLENAQATDESSQIRAQFLALLQDEADSLSARLDAVGKICDPGAPFSSEPVDPGQQLKIILELIVARVRTEFTPQRYLELYKNMAKAFRVEPGATFDEMGARYTDAFRRCYVPFRADYDGVLSRYLAAYAYKTMFPFGSPSVNRLLGLDRHPSPMRAHFMLMASYFAITRAVVAGQAACHQCSFAPDWVIPAIQSCARTLEHCTPFPLSVLRVLAGRLVQDAAGMRAIYAECV